jgi:hypothetical protein
MTFPTARPKAQPGKCSGVPRPSMDQKRYPGFVLENQETGRANTVRRQAISKTNV